MMRNAQLMRHAAGISYCLRAATFVLRTGDAILWPDFHRDADDLVALFTQQISGDAGVHSTAHPKKNTLLVWIHSNAEFRLSGARVNQVDRLLRRRCHGIAEG